MKADPAAQQRLLDLQAVDTARQQLAHRRTHLPEHAELTALEKELAELEDERIRAQVDVDDLDREFERVERDVEQVRQRRERDTARLEKASLPAREAEALQLEVDSLNRRQNELEDQQLALMERREQAQATLDDVTHRLDAARRRKAEAQTRRDEALADIDRQEAEQAALREPLVAELPDDLVALYERIRDDGGGVGAALLRGGRCGGCRLELSGSERVRIGNAPADEVVRCDECRRIMVRTAESRL